MQASATSTFIPPLSSEQVEIRFIDPNCGCDRHAFITSVPLSEVITGSESEIDRKITNIFKDNFPHKFCKHLTFVRQGLVEEEGKKILPVNLTHLDQDEVEGNDELENAKGDDELEEDDYEGDDDLLGVNFSLDELASSPLFVIRTNDRTFISSMSRVITSMSRMVFTPSAALTPSSEDTSTTFTMQADVRQSDGEKKA